MLIILIAIYFHQKKENIPLSNDVLHKDYDFVIGKARLSVYAYAYYPFPYKRKGPLRYVNTNRLMRNNRWDIALSKTGYINEAGRCLVMQTEIIGQPLTIILLNSFGKLTPFGDANRIRKWIEGGLKKS